MTSAPYPIHVDTDTKSSTQPAAASLSPIDPFHDSNTVLRRQSESERLPPSLNYPMTPPRKRSLYIAIFIIYFSTLLLSTIVFYVTKYGRHPNLKPVDYYSYTSTALGVLQLPQFPYRIWCLLRQNGRRSAVLPDPVEPGRASRKNIFQRFRSSLWWGLRRIDCFQVGFLIGIVLGTVPLVVSTSINGSKGYFPLLVLMPAIVLGGIGLAGLVITFLSDFTSVTQPTRFSTVPKGEPFRPVLFYIWSDLTGCDGGGGYEFRMALDRRYRQSPIFQRMVRYLSWLMTISFIGLCIVSFLLTYLLYTLGHPHQRLFEDINWAANMVLLAVWTGWTGLHGIRYGCRSMREEELSLENHSSMNLLY
ncbi:hypothetical protein CF326_g5663 [Tilletia indica]|nr:hypothetical protein CF326_g5663 [Tilletia indica]